MNDTMTDAHGGRGAVLVADDDAVNRKLLRRLLVRKGYEVIEVVGGGEALEVLRGNGGLRAVLLDVRMPEPDGLSVIRTWRAEEEGERRLPVIAVTANVSGEDQRRCRDAGMDAFLPKPVRARELYQTLDALDAVAVPAVAAPDEDRPRWLRDALDRMDGDGEILNELIRDFTAQAPAELALLARQSEQRDAEALRFSSHRLRGQLLNLGARDVAEAIDELEQHVRLGSRPGAVEAALETVTNAVDGLRERCRQADRYLGELARETGSERPLSQGRILVVEDERHTRRMIERFLERQGYEVAVADDGHKALERVAEWTPDLVLLDCLMPRLDGFETARRLRALPGEVGQAPILMLTILNDERSAEQAIDAGAQDFITKPLFLPVLRQRIRHIIDARHKERRVMELAYYDHLTGLLNRTSFDRLLERLVGETGPQGTRHVLLYMDLDKFKLINDNCGHHAGDEFLRQIGSVLRARLRQQDAVARLGGDEFGVLLHDCDLETGVQRAEELVQAVSGYRFEWEGAVYEVGASVGAVPLDDGVGSAERALTTADSACYSAKADGRNRVCSRSPHDPAMQVQDTQSRMVPRLLRALEDEAFVLYRQSIAALDEAAGHPPRYEVLLRLVEADDSILGPGQFIPAAERYQLMDRIDYWVTQRVCQRIAELGPGDQTTYHVNLSALSLNRPNFAGEIRELLRTFATPPERLCFEITETEAIRNLARARDTIRALTDFGCEFALDDFGAGLSSFGYLKELPVSMIKIDGGFVRDMATDEFDHAMVDAIHHMARVMRMQTVAEFVDSEAVLSRLRSMGVGYAQGFHLHRPEEWRVAGV